jgi:hypothetical protein
MQAPLGDSDLDWGGSPSAEPAPRNLRADGPPLRSVISQECEGAHIAADLHAVAAEFHGGNGHA